MNNKPAGLKSRVRLGRCWYCRNWDMLLVAPWRFAAAEVPTARRSPESELVCDGQQRIVDQAKAQGNAWDTGVVPGHPRMELNSTCAEEVKINLQQRSLE